MASGSTRNARARALRSWLGLLLGLVVVSVWWCVARAPSRGPAVVNPPPLSEAPLLTAQDRVLILAPHPDDETINCGGLIQRALAMHVPVRVVFLTYGDNNEWSFLVYRKRLVLRPKAVRRMGLLRHEEALAATTLLGLQPSQLTFLGYPDFGTLAIWNEHWGNRPPFRSMLTHTDHVPYDNALRPGASYTGEEIVRDLVTVLREFRPTKILVSHPADHNGDHRALYLFTRVALWELAGELQPEVYPYLTHFARWPRPRGRHTDRMLEPPPFLRDQIPWQVFPLSAAEVERKLQALRAHRTQYTFSAKYLLSFMRRNELFGDFPTVTLRHAAGSASPESAQPLEPAPGHREATEELSDVERAAFVGVEWRFVRWEGRDLVLTMELSRPLAEETQLVVYLFGARDDRSFAAMPKVRVKLGIIGHAIYDQRRKLSAGLITVTREPRRLTIRVPLDALGNPRRLLTSARTYLGDVPLDWAAWRVLELPEPDVLQ